MKEIQSHIVVYKEVGETPLDALKRTRGEYGISTEIPMTYAGRLDPMAEGILLVLIGEECKKREKYLALKKEYEVEVLFGVGTDTGDILGKVKDKRQEIKNTKSKVLEIIKSFEGKFIQEYPAFSSKTVEGRPLFAYAKSGSLPKNLPTKEVEIFKINLLEEKTIKAKVFLKTIEEKISKVKGDFRQEEILTLWRERLIESKEVFEVVKIKVVCSSGTYMRVLAQKIGENFGTDAVACSIKRTMILGI